MHSIIAYPTLEEGYAACTLLGAHPFVVRRNLESNSTCEFNERATVQAISSQIRVEREIKGYGENGSQSSSGREALAAWNNDELLFNVVDSASTRGNSLLSHSLAEIGRNAGVDEDFLLAYVLSPVSLNGQAGELHIDPPYGSGWQYLAGDSSKTWFIIDGNDVNFSLTDYNAAHPIPRAAPDMHAIDASMFPSHCYTATIGKSVLSFCLFVV